MSLKILTVGDVHAESSDLEDCEALLGHVVEKVKEQKPDVVLFMGDQYDRHDTVSVKCIEFWNRWFGVLKPLLPYRTIFSNTPNSGVSALVGNHDKSSPFAQYPHAMISHDAEGGIQVIDRPFVQDGVAFFPHFQEQEDFLEAQGACPGAHLYCHQTFEGAQYENGFPAKDAVKIDDLTFKRVVSGHIHSPQEIVGASSSVVYVGAPRWRTEFDSRVKERWLWLFTHNDDGGVVAFDKFPLSGVCRQIVRLQDRPEKPAEVTALGPRSVLSIDVYGPTREYVRTRESALRVAHPGVRTRGFPDRVESVGRVTESEGVVAALSKFVGRFKAPNGTAQDRLTSEVAARLGPAWAR